MKAKAQAAPVETEEQRQSRLQAEQANVSAIQGTTLERTSILSRVRSPRLGIVNGQVAQGVRLT